ncbi:MAG: precorrin-8X methylmutase [Methanimicrococcus sp.]|nr:precorrin-8X methylmutase [Methanimicrococcus sp.]
MSGKDQTEMEISISEIYDQLRSTPAATPKKEKKQIEFNELCDDVNENRIRKMCTEVSGDIDFRRFLLFKTHPVASALKAFKNESVIYTDTPLMKFAILARIQSENEKTLIDKPRGGFEDKPVKKILLKEPEIICVSEHQKAEEIAAKFNVSKAMAGFMIYKDELSKSIIVIGQDDSSLLSVCRMVERGVLPYLILGFPAGINTQTTAKEYLANMPLEIPLITMQQTKGGVEPAAAGLIELMKIYEEGL